MMRGFFDRYLTPRVALALAALLLVASWAYPPWVHYGRTAHESVEVSHGWFFIFDTKQEETNNSSVVMRIDVGRLVLSDAIISVFCGGLAWACSRGGAARLAAAAILVALPVGVAGIFATKAYWTHTYYANQARLANERLTLRVVTLREALRKNVPKSPTAREILEGIRQGRQLGCSDQEIYNTLALQFTGFIANSELNGSGYLIAINDGQTLGALETALLKDAAAVKPDDLKKITLFDVATDMKAGRWAIGFHGRVRNELLRKVHNLMLKASFYNDSKELIEERTFSLHTTYFAPAPLTLSAGAAVSFKDFCEVEHLPEGWTWKLEIVAAQYVE